MFNRSTMKKSVRVTGRSSPLRQSRSPMRQSTRSPMRSPLRQSTRSPMRQSTRSPIRGVSPQRSPNRSVIIGGAPTVASGQQVTMVRKVPENPTPDQKLRFVFKELDMKDDNKVTLDGFRRVLKALNIAFTEATVIDLFERADVDKAGSINYSEFLNFARHYPLLIEAIYSRCKELFDVAGREDEMAASRGNQETLQRRERDMNQQWDDAKGALNAQQLQLEAMEESARAAQEALRDRTKELVTMQQDLDMAKAEMTIKGRDLDDAKEVHHKAQKPLRDTERNLEISQERLESTEITLEGCHERVRELDAMLEEAKREAQQHVDLITEINDNITELREHAAELATVVEDAGKEAAQQQAEFNEAESVVRNSKQEIGVAELVKAEAHLAAKNLAAQVEDERKGLIPFRKREDDQAAAHAAALRAFEEADQALQQLEANQGAYQQNRADVEEAEQALLENEVRLREQRQNVNTRDDVLWAEGGNFLAVCGRSDTRIATTNGKTRGV